MQDRQDRIETLRARIGRSEYFLPGEAIAEVMLSMPVGEMTPEQRALLTEPTRQRNEEAGRRLRDEPPLMGFCNDRQASYPVVYGIRRHDCPECFQAVVSRRLEKLREQNRDRELQVMTQAQYREYLSQERLVDYQRRCECFLEEVGMAEQMAGMDSRQPEVIDSPKPLTRLLPYALALFVAIPLLTLSPYGVALAFTVAICAIVWALVR